MLPESEDVVAGLQWLSMVITEALLLPVTSATSLDGVLDSIAAEWSVDVISFYCSVKIRSSVTSVN